MKDCPGIWRKTKFYLANTLEMMVFAGVNSAADAERQKVVERTRRHHPVHWGRDSGSG